MFSTTPSHLSLPGIHPWNDLIGPIVQVSLSFQQLTGQKTPDMLHNEKLEVLSSLLFCLTDKETELRGTIGHMVQPNEHQTKSTEKRSV